MTTILLQKNIISIREKEQKFAASVLGVNIVRYLIYEDGMIVANLEARKNIVRIIRKLKPNIGVACDTTNYI